ncbi:Uncharacterized protein HZ326_22627 [Fusarium oxysporum f. sp. albedinis]|nr:Uncharacterized protein HZ326_22627 [Fusarium oxysporum f. sp. albedinis]
MASRLSMGMKGHLSSLLYIRKSSGHLLLAVHACMRYHMCSTMRPHLALVELKRTLLVRCELAAMYGRL